MNENALEKKVKRYCSITQKAINKVSIKKGLSKKELEIAKDFLSMAQNYSNDAKYFKQKKDFANALAAYSYAHAWLDAGVRAKIFNSSGDSSLFTLP